MIERRIAMGWSFRIARIAGIDIKVHVTFFLILILAAVQWNGIAGGATGALFGVVLMILLFTCVTLHELGHSIAAKYFGIPVREITLLPLGGVAQLSKNPDKPLHELIIAAAGPLVNVIIAGLLLIPIGSELRMNLLDGQGLLPDARSTSFTTMLFWLLAANISLVVFNLIPAFPLDGGRILRALLAMAISYQRATRIAATIGQIIAIGLGVYGVVSGQFTLVLIAIFIFFGAGQENSAAQSKTVLITKKIGDAYNKHALTLQIGDRVSRVTDYILTSYQPDFAVMQGSMPIGIVTREDVLRALATMTNDAFVTEIMRREIHKLDAQITLDQARDEMAEKASRVAAVFSGGQYLGLVSQDDIKEAFAVLAFMQLRERRSAKPSVET
jgi:Zn-dependent protease/CBS domain-containing protein